MGTQNPWENIPTSLTEFGPLSSEVKPSGGFLSRFLKRGKDDSDSGSSSAAGSESSSREPSIERAISYVVVDDVGGTAVASDEGSPQRQAPAGEDEISKSVESSGSQGQSQWDQETNVPTRTLSSVLSRLGNILDRRSTTPQMYKDSDFKQYWMPDNRCKECYDCGDKFTTFRRRHHCRICGQIFCSKCCNQELPGKIIGYKGGIRVCTYCCKVVLRYAQQSESTRDVKVLNEDLKNISPIDSESGSFQEFGLWTPALRKISIVRDETTPQQRAVSPQDSTGNGVQKSIPFDLTPQADFTMQESLLMERKILIQDSVQLRGLWRQIQDAEAGVEMQSHRVRLRTHQNCIVGKELVDWLLKYDKAAKRDQAVAIGQALLFAGYLEPVSSPLLVFRDDFSLYKPGEQASVVMETQCELECQPNGGEEIASSEPLWFQEIESVQKDDDSVSVSEEQRSSTTDSDRRKSESSETGSRAVFYLSERSDSESISNELTKLSAVPRDVNEEPLPRQDSSSTGMTEDFLKGALAVGKTMPSSSDTIFCPHGWRNAEQLREENGEKLAYERLWRAHSELWDALTKQLLSQRGLSLSWEPIVALFISQISRFVRPDVQVEGDDPDIRKYIHIKKIPGGTKQETTLTHGVVFTKNIAHKKMKQQIGNPQILLLRGAIEYQRIENKFSSLEPQILQEREFLKNSVAKIAAFRPSVLVVEKSVSRLAQEFLLDAGITLVFNVKQSVMERLARFTQADIVQSIDGLVSRPTLGFCHNFKCQSFLQPNGEAKTLVIFDGCATHLGCTICLQGGMAGELKRVKEILKFMSYTSYNSILEMSFCMDEFALPPPHPEEISPLSEFEPSHMEKQMDADYCTPENGAENTEMKKENEDGAMVEVYTSFEEVSTDELQEVSNSHSLDKGKENNDKKFQNDDSNTVVMRKKNRDNAESPSSLQLCKDNLKRRSTELTELTDLSDPLHSYQKNKDDSIFQSTVEFQEHKQTKQYRFKKALNGLILSVSPYHKYDVPYLESEPGSKSEPRVYLSEDIYWSPLFGGEQGQRLRSKYYDMDYSVCYPQKSNIQITEAHPFILCKLTAPLHDNITQSLLSDFRARGGRIHVLARKHLKNTGNGIQKEASPQRQNVIDDLTENEPSKGAIFWERRVDCLDPANHQQISVLFSSYSHKSANHPNPCVLPWVVKMEFYGNNDITLGGFLERFCFRESYLCPSVYCETPMVDHIRRFAHGSGCINVLLKKLDNLIAGGQNNILMWSWCCRCKQVTPVVPISADTWNLSFAKYLELRFYGSTFLRRATAEPCNHSLHLDHNQYFGYRDIVASFRYSEVMLRELALPPIIVGLQLLPIHPEKMKDVVGHITTRGMERYSLILECTMKLRNEIQNESTVRAVSEFVTEQQTEKAELREFALDVQQKLQDLGNDTESQPICDNSNAMLEIQDDIIQLKRLISEAVAKWNTKIQDFLTNQQKKYKQQTGAKKEKDKDSYLEEAIDRGSPKNDDKGQLPLSRSGSSDMQNTEIVEPEASGIISLSSQLPDRNSGSSGNLESIREDDTVDGRSDKRGPMRTSRNIIASLWSGTSFTPIAQPFDPSEHHLLPPSERVPVVVYDHEPSSVIAYALSCSDYHIRLREIQSYFGMHKDSQFASSAQSRSSQKSSELASGAVDAVIETDEVDGFSLFSAAAAAIDVEKSKANNKQTVSPHIELQFSDSGARFYCRVYFAEQFHKLRKLIFPAGEDIFIRSLSRCKPWEAKGGKSGSKFCKTDDDRFILKQMSGMEVESFEKFGPQYFHYVSKAYTEKQPTALAKILGVYKIGFRNTQTNHALKQDLLVVENLFYNRKITQKFDLKGSMRNRLVNTTGKREEELVLLDENLLKLCVESPLYMRPHSKTVLKAAITSDSQFLSANLVMDYSLLVGIDDVSKELVVGIIDYIRTFTWDKKLEMVVKSQIAIIGGQGKMPTVVSPQLYRSRYLEAMDRYFLHVPDQWSGLGCDIPSNKEPWKQKSEDNEMQHKR